ncbi:hypothetical protein KCTC32516_01211 [Polaribacter huanghezhanensis]|uniref:hypothetical protein n=1 Tax=Polaribacter huanghezhanensis TaxID=1354726 RepID=UPI0026483747|nr:hypothetical protein [Polaribacter huanghezhanensis]WKD85864.1 hypothetical protein KCTC32516_01211 [Polaribacter huanghezhanensis]
MEATQRKTNYPRAIGAGVITSVAISIVMVIATKTGISPFPKPVGLAFVQLFLPKAPLPLGLLFHTLYVTFWSVIYITFFKKRNFINAIWLALALWIGVLTIFFPVLGWGFFGLAISPKLIVASLIPHALFAVIIWRTSLLMFPKKEAKGQ